MEDHTMLHVANRQRGSNEIFMNYDTACISRSAVHDD